MTNSPEFCSILQFAPDRGNQILVGTFSAERFFADGSTRHRRVKLMKTPNKSSPDSARGRNLGVRRN